MSSTTDYAAKARELACGEPGCRDSICAEKTERIEAALREAAEAEREACAVAADDTSEPFSDSDFFEGMRQGRRVAAASIRARGVAK